MQPDRILVPVSRHEEHDQQAEHEEARRPTPPAPAGRVGAEAPRRAWWRPTATRRTGTATQAGHEGAQNLEGPGAGDAPADEAPDQRVLGDRAGQTAMHRLLEPCTSSDLPGHARVTPGCPAQLGVQGVGLNDGGAVVGVVVAGAPGPLRSASSAVAGGAVVRS